ncbi:MAG TPA: 2Fe-2S iron-sulfur cluster binding domain-containing protein [Clostridiales bacterium]|nr:2Fe-2S iron-sulfur cluster binding domain-containing protein [Clostridiales bacterium]
MINLTINGIEVSAPEGSTILEAARLNHIKIPSLCYLENIHAIGACRICVVEVKGARNLQASCITKAEDGMVVYTNSERVQKARKVLYELLLSDHNKDCLNCSRNTNCELQTLGKQLGVEESRFEGENSPYELDISVSLTRDTSKCILCRRCVTICNEIQGTGILNPQNRGFDTIISPGMDLPMGSVNCAFCGQCTVVCPVGALKETSSIHKVWKAINDPEMRVVVQTAPAIRVAIGEEFGLPPGTRCTGKLASALFRLGFDDIFDTNWAADLTILEEGTELLNRLNNALTEDNAVLPMITSCSPGWIKYIEHAYPHLLPHLSTCKSPHMMMGAVVKSYYAEKIGISPDKIFVVSVMPCTAKKFEIARPELKNNGLPNVDAVLTCRELADMIKEAGIDFANLPDREFDAPLGISTGAADIFGITGGVMEAALRTVYEFVTGRELPFENLHVKPVMGLDGVKEAVIKIEKPMDAFKHLDGVEVRVAVTSGLKNAKVLLEQIDKGISPYHFIEVMGCPGGCITGGGQPRSQDPFVWEKRMKNLYSEDESKVVRKSHENPSIIAFYKEYLGQPNGHLAHELLHTHYVQRGVFNQLSNQTFVIEHQLPKKQQLSKIEGSVETSDKKTSPARNREEPESLRILNLESENKNLRAKLSDAMETIDILKMVISDYSKQK